MPAGEADAKVAKEEGESEGAMKIGAIFDRMLDYLAYIAGGLFVFAWLLVCADTLLRYFLNRPLPWALDITEYTLLYVTFLGSAWLLRGEGHVAVDVVVNRLRPKTRNGFNIATSIAGAIVSLALVWYGIQITDYLFRSNIRYPTTLHFPEGAVTIIVPVGSFLLFIQFLRRAWKLRRDYGASSSQKERV